MKTFYYCFLTTFLTLFGFSSFSQCLFSDYEKEFFNHNGKYDGQTLTFGNYAGVGYQKSGDTIFNTGGIVGTIGLKENTQNKFISLATEYQTTNITRCVFINAYANFDFSKFPYNSKKIVLDILFGAAQAIIVINGDTVKNFTTLSNNEYKPGLFITYTNGKGIFEGDIKNLTLGGFEFGITEMCISESVITNLNNSKINAHIDIQYNQAFGNITVKPVNVSLKNKEYRITDVMGHAIKYGRFDSDNASISVDDLAQGMYLLVIDDNDSLLTERFVR